MNPHEFRQMTLHYSFPFKFFELLQFGGKHILENSPVFPGIFDKIKELGLFATSRLYLKSSEVGFGKDEFANYRIDLIHENDYRQIHFNYLIKDYEFPADRYNLSEMAPYWRTTPRYIDPQSMHKIIKAALRLHVSETSEIYRLEVPTLNDKYGLAIIWEDLQHYLCIDREQNLVQMITSGFD